MTCENGQVSLAVRALKELPDDERLLYRARYFADEAPEKTCSRLGITAERYDELLRAMMLSLRRMTSRVTVTARQLDMRGSA